MFAGSIAAALVDGITGREFDRASRRTRYTGIPIDRTMRQEIARRKRQIEAGQLSPVYPALAEGATSIKNDPEHESVLPISEAPSPIPEENPQAELYAQVASQKDPIPDQTLDPETFGEPDAVVDPTKVEDEAAFAEDVAQEVAAKQKNVGRPVSWTQMGKEYRGTIAHVIPPNTNPRTMGIEAGATPKKGEAPKTRDHISYVVKNDETGALAWPMRSSLTVLDAE